LLFLSGTSNRFVVWKLEAAFWFVLIFVKTFRLFRPGKRMLFELDNVVGDSATPIYYFFAITLFLASVNGQTASLELSNNQFLVYRVHQIDLPHGKLGSRGSPFSLEAITPSHLEERFIRKCAIFKFQELLQDQYSTFVDRVLDKAFVSGVLVLFKDSDFSKKSLTDQALSNLEALERRLLTNSTDIPIFFTEDNEQISELYEQYKAGGNDQQAVGNTAWKTVFQDSHQLVITEGDMAAIASPMVTSFQVKLSGSGAEEQLPTYVIVAHYDAYSLLPVSFSLFFFNQFLTNLFSQTFSHSHSAPILTPAVW